MGLAIRPVKFINVNFPNHTRDFSIKYSIAQRRLGGPVPDLIQFYKSGSARESSPRRLGKLTDKLTALPMGFIYIHLCPVYLVSNIFRLCNICFCWYHNWNNFVSLNFPDSFNLNILNLEQVYLLVCFFFIEILLSGIFISEGFHYYYYYYYYYYYHHHPYNSRLFVSS